MDQDQKPQLARLKSIHIMLIVGLIAIVFGVLNSKSTDSVIALAGLVVIAYLWLFWTMLRPNPLKAVLANLPKDRDESIAALEEGLACCNPYDVGTNLMARFRLMQLYKVQKQYQEAIVQGRLILKMSGIRPDLENEVRAEIAALPEKWSASLCHCP